MAMRTRSGRLGGLQSAPGSFRTTEGPQLFRPVTGGEPCRRDLQASWTRALRSTALRSAYVLRAAGRPLFGEGKSIARQRGAVCASCGFAANEAISWGVAHSPNGIAARAGVS